MSAGRWTILRICINGKPLDVAAGETLLTSARLAGIHIPALCSDPRVKPLGACRMCLVQVEGERRPVAACSTLVREGMKVETHTPEIERFRKGLLELLAGGYPAEAVRETPEKPFHKLLAEYGVACSQGITASIDDRHPYIHIDMSRCILVVGVSEFVKRYKANSSGVPGVEVMQSSFVRAWLVASLRAHVPVVAHVSIAVLQEHWTTSVSLRWERPQNGHAPYVPIAGQAAKSM